MEFHAFWASWSSWEGWMAFIGVLIVFELAAIRHAIVHRDEIRRDEAESERMRHEGEIDRKLAEERKR
jgi:hypothetical protein